MNNSAQPLIAEAQKRLLDQEAAVAATKKFINQICDFSNIPKLYPDSETESGSAARAATITRNSFYGRPLATCVRELLSMRETSPTKEATLDEIVDALKLGGYDLGNHGQTEGDQRRGVAISLAKNSQTFHRLPNEDWGLSEWYSNVRKKKGKDDKKSDGQGSVDLDQTAQSQGDVAEQNNDSAEDIGDSAESEVSDSNQSTAS